MNTETSILVAIVVVLFVVMAVIGVTSGAVDEIEKDLFGKEGFTSGVKDSSGETQFTSSPVKRPEKVERLEV